MTSQLLINEPPLQVLPTLAQKVGLNEAIILQQVHYWLNPQFNKHFFKGRHWVHNTFTQWQQQFSFWSPKTIKRTIAGLEESGLLVSFVTRHFKKTKYYTLNYELLGSIGTPQKDGAYDLKTEHFQKRQPWGQVGSFDQANMALSMRSESLSRSGQPDPFDGVKVTPFHYTENTISENTLPPLSPPSSRFWKTIEEEEDAIQAKQDEQPAEALYPKIKTANRNFKHLPYLAGNNATEPYQEERQYMDTQHAQKYQHQPFLDMIAIWNQTVHKKLNSNPEAPLLEPRLTEKRKTLLSKILSTVFACDARDNNLDSWQTYCTLIANSRFLMGHNPSHFKVSLDWALIPDNAYKVLEGALYDKPEDLKDPSTHDLPSDLPWEEFAENLVRSLPSGKYLIQWVKISVNLAKLLGQQKYKSWFSKVTLRDMTATKATFGVEGNFVKEYIRTHFFSELQCAVQTSYPQITEFELETISSLEGGV